MSIASVVCVVSGPPLAIGHPLPYTTSWLLQDRSNMCSEPHKKTQTKRKRREKFMRALPAETDVICYMLRNILVFIQ